ncbi:GtrA family protein, partial [Escherichia coli]|nr:GtrA family protein [Escherichia coli]
GCGAAVSELGGGVRRRRQPGRDGGCGAGVHFLVLGVLFRGLAWPFVGATILATAAAMTFNFFLNNALTYREQRLKGGGALLAG